MNLIQNQRAQAEPHSDEALFELLAHVAPDERSRTRLLADNPARLYGFPSPV